ncbi:MAG: 50S ribosomal protein L21 [Candidatus Sumerlaeia bacterium]|nr:50S ribosomal protein L21 [Candidatus Sumerlaeia bacterium]
MTYAILRQGGHQYRVAPGDIIQIEKLDAEKGQVLELEDVLALHDGAKLEFGVPRVADAQVKARVLRNGRGRKIVVFKMKKRKGHHRKQGHRQDFTEIMVTGITRNGQPVGA